MFDPRFHDPLPDGPLFDTIMIIVGLGLWSFVGIWAASSKETDFPWWIDLILIGPLGLCVAVLSIGWEDYVAKLPWKEWTFEMLLELLLVLGFVVVLLWLVFVAPIVFLRRDLADYHAHRGRYA